MQKHTWDTVIFSQSASCLSLSMILMLFIQSTCLVATSGRTVVVLGGSWWKWYPAHLTIRSDDKIVGGGGGMSGRWDNGGRPPGDGALMAQLTLSDISNCGNGFPLTSQRLQSSTEKKAATWRRKRFNFNHVSYSAERTCTHTHTSMNTHSHTRTSTHGLGQSPKADFSDNQSGE